MTTLTNLLRISLANETAFAAQAQSFHWNVRGALFSQLHAFFGTVYADAYAAVDPLAEYIRMEGETAPASLPDLYRHHTVAELDYVPGTAHEMLNHLLKMNTQVQESLELLYDEASSQKRIAIENWVAARIDAHSKLGWMLRAHLEL